jgi:hypothetical protein
MGIAIASTFQKTGESLRDMVSVKEVLGMVVAGVTMYAVLWVIPEPTSKAIAAAMTIVLVGYVGVDTLYTLGAGWKELIDHAGTATTFEELKAEGERFARVMGADNARILVMVATAAVGSGLGQLAKLLPTLPGAGPASELAVAEGGVPFQQLGAVESVTIGERGLTIALAPGAVVMSSSVSGNGGFRGSKRAPLANPSYQELQNGDAMIGGREFGGHALDQMRNRGLTPSVVEDAIQTGTRTPDPIPGRFRFYDAKNNLTVITEGERVVTVIPGEH